MPLDTMKTIEAATSHDLASTVWKGIIGTGAPLVGAITSFQEQFEWGLRIASLLIGILVGLLSVLSILKKWRAKPAPDDE